MNLFFFSAILFTYTSINSCITKVMNDVFLLHSKGPCFQHHSGKWNHIRTGWAGSAWNRTVEQRERFGLMVEMRLMLEPRDVFRSITIFNLTRHLINKINSVEIACVILGKQNSEIAGNILVLRLPVSKVYANRLSCMMLVVFDSCRSRLYLITLGSALNDQNL